MTDPLFDAVSRETLESDASIIYALDRELSLIYANPAWDAFASRNGGSHLTRDRLRPKPVLHSMAPQLRPFYGDLFRRVLDTGKAAEHLYQCSSHDLYREFRMRVLPLGKGSGLVTIHSICEERPHSVEPSAADLGRYTAPDGMITMCSHCRRTQRRETDVWEWVPSFVLDQPASLTHGLCAICLDYYYLNGKSRRVRSF